MAMLKGDEKSYVCNVQIDDLYVYKERRGNATKQANPFCTDKACRSECLHHAAMAVVSASKRDTSMLTCDVTIHCLLVTAVH